MGAHEKYYLNQLQNASLSSLPEQHKNRAILLWKKLAYYRHGLKCRDKWLRRRGYPAVYVGTCNDSVYIKLYKKCDAYYRILSRLTGRKYV